jgi:hypothetical protein
MRDKLRVVGRAFLAAVTSPEAVTQERGLAALIVFRLLLAVGATAGFAEAVKAVITG